MQMDIREATVGDAQNIATVHVASWQAAYQGIMPAGFLEDLSVAARTRNWQSALTAGKLRVLLASVDGVLAGWVAFGACRDADKDSRWSEVEALYVSPAYWRHGVGHALRVAACAQLQQAGYEHVVLWVLAANQRAIAFYERAGFVRDQASKDIVAGGVPLTEVRYCKALAASLNNSVSPLLEKDNEVIEQTDVLEARVRGGDDSASPATSRDKQER
ncbi:GNAT family N-acetyltransferase [Paraburkholderia sp. DHOC27]|uniref:GNAT family N-acetyltransferase n=1 Tax=Paraburkholderia sp. DHOC27 TaxID=2303330 RepID=UPI000E3D5085|nr:GNAT family N-acetyltransferase [Paraburkholderia sp. DHOC27]RFU49504.1 GNAT family N-acetyltransferase [Paraburkholderia sp. DHOC27]